MRRTRARRHASSAPKTRQTPLFHGLKRDLGFSVVAVHVATSTPDDARAAALIT